MSVSCLKEFSKPWHLMLEILPPASVLLPHSPIVVPPVLQPAGPEGQPGDLPVVQDGGDPEGGAHDHKVALPARVATLQADCKFFIDINAIDQ